MNLVGRAAAVAALDKVLAGLSGGSRTVPAPEQIGENPHEHITGSPELARDVTQEFTADVRGHVTSPEPGALT